MRIWKYSGTFLSATGIIHTLYALISRWEPYKAIICDGFINSVGENVERDSALWFMVCGIFLIIFGQTLQYYIKKEQKPAPLFFGYSLLILSVLGCIAVPVSGFWLFIPQALIVILAKRK